MPCALFKRQTGNGSRAGRGRSRIEVASSHEPEPLRVRLQGLEPQTTYYYRVTSEDSTGQSDGVEGPVSHFITPPPGEVINNFPQPKS